MTTTKPTVTREGWSRGHAFCKVMYNIFFSSDLCNNFHTGKMQCCRIFMERNSAWNGVTFRQGWGVIWLKWMNKNNSLIICLEQAINYYVFYRISQYDTAFCYNTCNSSNGLDFLPIKKMTISQACGYFKWSRKLNFIPLCTYTVKLSVPQEETNILTK
jgi:hypothetical protein